jgi:endoglucanase
MKKSMTLKSSLLVTIFALISCSGASSDDNGEVLPDNKKDEAVYPEGMKSDAKELVSQIKIGWSLGNSLEAYYDGAQDTETSWGNPKSTETMIKAVKAAGFNAIRIPVRWYPHATNDDNIKVDAAWMKRVKEVVDYCINNDLYVIINTHHEMWLESYPLYAHATAVKRKETNLWTQIAYYFKGYDEHLLFAGTNEVHIPDNWGTPTAENVSVQNGFNQTFVDAVRATGGNNQYRNLIVQTYVCSPENGLNSMVIPTDATKNRIIVEFHCYQPTNYCLQDDVKFWGSEYKAYGISEWGQEDYFTNLFARLKSAFVDKGYPLILGEFGVVHHSYSAELQAQRGAESRAKYITNIVSLARKNGIAPFWWDNGGIKEGTECFGLFDRNNGMKLVDATAVDAMLEGAKSSYPF